MSRDNVWKTRKSAPKPASAAGPKKPGIKVKSGIRVGGVDVNHCRRALQSVLGLFADPVRKAVRGW